MCASLHVCVRLCVEQFECETVNIELLVLLVLLVLSITISSISLLLY